ncbi:hypothetical protein ACFL20_08835 [Spirochaetota bacterium]
MNKTLKVITVIIALVITASSVKASIFVDADYPVIDAGDGQFQYFGLALGLGMDINPNINIISRVAFTTTAPEEKDILGIPTKTEYSHWSFRVGLEYIPTIKFLEYLKLRLKFSFLAGVSETDVSLELKDGSGMDSGDSDMGLSLAIWASVGLDVFNYLTPFVGFGYHYSHYIESFRENNISGIMAFAGVRYYFWGKSRRVDDEY